MDTKTIAQSLKEGNLGAATEGMVFLTKGTPLHPYALRIRLALESAPQDGSLDPDLRNHLQYLLHELIDTGSAIPVAESLNYKILFKERAYEISTAFKIERETVAITIADFDQEKIEEIHEVLRQHYPKSQNILLDLTFLDRHSLLFVVAFIQSKSLLKNSKPLFLSGIDPVDFMLEVGDCRFRTFSSLARAAAFFKPPKQLPS